MLLADFRMPSMTGSEAVSKYIYVSELVLAIQGE